MLEATEVRVPRRVSQGEVRWHPPGPDDPRAYVVDEELFRFMVEMEIRQGLRLQYPITVVTILGTPGAGESSPSSGGPSESMAELMAEAARGVVRRSDLVMPLTDAPGIRILLVGTLLSDADVALERVRGALPPALRLEVGTACSPANASSARELLAQADAGAREGRARTDRVARRRTALPGPVLRVPGRPHPVSDAGRDRDRRVRDVVSARRQDDRVVRKPSPTPTTGPIQAR
jgi:hypothetical protein